MSNLGSLIKKRMRDYAAQDFTSAQDAMKKQKAADAAQKRKRILQIEDKEIDLIISYFAGVGKGQQSARQLDLF
jgi:hypothetical protein